jgi:hypothetical protein
MSVMIGIDPHKGSHAAAVVDAGEVTLAELEVKATRRQTRELLAWAERFPLFGSGAVAVGEYAGVLDAETAHVGAFGVFGEAGGVEGFDLVGDGEVFVGDGAVGDAGVGHGHLEGRGVKAVR